MSKKSAFTHWIKLLWKKKKVYIQLIPHFFDQATDFGVIYEYWDIYQTGGVDGINVLYLFGVSIVIIILHRIVSSIAVYRLTKNWKYSVLQIFDLLMIQCVYTNYVLDTDEPSNAQRYLQVLEATFESAPQILISTAFLVKAQNTDVSAVVYISLITSFWTLAGRVASDDKAMMKKDWTNIDFNLRKSPCINGRYIVRVLLWRFLEISSRVAILTIVWINLGGLTIFILVGLELLYLAILSYAIGTIDIMGNIVYLRAANSNKSGKNWGQTMTYYFWIYRVVSVYILLILSTIFATTQFDAKHIQDYDARNVQTLRESVGLVVFIYCWVATPLWQWIGAIIVFDHGNLQSISRDIDQLVEQEKWLDVWELIKFGATDFYVERALKKLFYSENVGETLLDALASIFCDLCINRGIINWQRLFMDACKANNFKLVKLICDRKEKIQIDMDKPDISGRTPIFYCDKMEIIEYLVKVHQVNCQIRDDAGNTILHYYMKTKFYCKEGYLQNPTLLPIIKCIVEESNLNPNTKDQAGNDLFIVANNTNQSDRIQAYLSQQCDKQLTAIPQETMQSSRAKLVISKAQTYTLKDDEQNNKLHNPINWNKHTEKPSNSINKLLITRIGVECIGFLIIVMMLIGIDIVLLALQQQNKCKSKNDDLIPLNIWIMVGTSFSFPMSIVFLPFVPIVLFHGIFECFESIWDKCSEKLYCASRVCSVLVLLIFNISWLGIGIVVYQDIDDSTTFNRQCSDAVLAWIILKFCVVIGVCVYLGLVLADYAELKHFYYEFRGGCPGKYYYMGCWTCWDCKCCGRVYDDDYVKAEKDASGVELKIGDDEQRGIAEFKSNRVKRNNDIKEEDIPNCHKCNAKMLATEIEKYDTRKCYGCTKKLTELVFLHRKEFAWMCQDFAKEIVHQEDYILCIGCGIKKNNESEIEFVDIAQKRQEKALQFLTDSNIQKKDVPKCKFCEKLYLFKAKEVDWYWDSRSIMCSECNAFKRDDELVWHCGNHDYSLCFACGIKQVKGTLQSFVLKKERGRVLLKLPICKCNEMMYRAYNPSWKYTIGLKACNGKYLRVNGYAYNKKANDWFIPDGERCNGHCRQTFIVKPSKHPGNRVIFFHQYLSKYGYLSCKKNRAWLNDSHRMNTDWVIDHEMIRCDDKWAIKSYHGTYLSIRKLDFDDAPQVWWSDRLGEAEKFTVLIIEPHGPDKDDEAEGKDEDMKEYQVSCNECKEEFHFDGLIHCQRKKKQHRNDYRLCNACKETRNIEVYSSELKEITHKISDELVKIKGIEKMDIPDCKCNEQMIMIEVEDAKYLGHHEEYIHCNQCGKKCKDDAIMWYCDAAKHPQGYALCLECSSIFKRAGNETANDTRTANVNKDLYID